MNIFGKGIESFKKGLEKTREFLGMDVRKVGAVFGEKMQSLTGKQDIEAKMANVEELIQKKLQSIDKVNDNHVYFDEAYVSPTSTEKAIMPRRWFVEDPEVQEVLRDIGCKFIASADMRGLGMLDKRTTTLPDSPHKKNTADLMIAEITKLADTLRPKGLIIVREKRGDEFIFIGLNDDTYDTFAKLYEEKRQYILEHTEGMEILEFGEVMKKAKNTVSGEIKKVSVSENPIENQKATQELLSSKLDQNIVNRPLQAKHTLDTLKVSYELSHKNHENEEKVQLFNTVYSTLEQYLSVLHRQREDIYLLSSYYQRMYSGIEVKKYQNAIKKIESELRITKQEQVTALSKIIEKIPFLEFDENNTHYLKLLFEEQRDIEEMIFIEEAQRDTFFQTAIQNAWQIAQNNKEYVMSEFINIQLEFQYTFYLAATLAPTNEAGSFITAATNLLPFQRLQNIEGMLQNLEKKVSTQKKSEIYFGTYPYKETAPTEVSYEFEQLLLRKNILKRIELDDDIFEHLDIDREKELHILEFDFTGLKDLNSIEQQQIANGTIEEIFRVIHHRTVKTSMSNIRIQVVQIGGSFFVLAQDMAPTPTQKKKNREETIHNLLNELYEKADISTKKYLENQLSHSAKANFVKSQTGRLIAEEKEPMYLGLKKVDNKVESLRDMKQIHTLADIAAPKSGGTSLIEKRKTLVKERKTY